MKLEELLNMIDGETLTEEAELSREIRGGCGADLMSDVLASIQPYAVLLTGLCNPQVVRTAQMADVAAIVFVRGKRPSRETIELANRYHVVILNSPLTTFELATRLVEAGIK